MKKVLICIASFAYLTAFFSCAAGSKRKSAEYYTENKKAINQLRNLYEELYHHQPFSAGFTDKSLAYYVMEITTDTVRYIYNSEKNRDQLYETIEKFQYDTSLLRLFSQKMKEVKCLWLSKSSFYVNERWETVTFFSFKAASSDRPFVENKYYILIFPGSPLSNEKIAGKVEKGSLVKIENMVYFTISSRYR
jgi:hypothetical protein